MLSVEKKNSHSYHYLREQKNIVFKIWVNLKLIYSIKTLRQIIFKLTKVLVNYKKTKLFAFLAISGFEKNLCLRSCGLTAWPPLIPIISYQSYTPHLPWAH